MSRTVIAGGIPLLYKEGWLRQQPKWPRSLAAQTGWLFIENHPGRLHFCFALPGSRSAAATPPWKGGECL